MDRSRKKRSVALASQYASIGGLLRHYLTETAGLEVAWEVHTIAETVRHCRRHAPTVLVVSPHFSDGSVVEATRTVRQEHPSMRILLFAGVLHRELVQDMMAAQVHGIVAAHSPLPTLLTAITILLEGGCFFDGVAESLLHAPPDQQSTLSQRERWVLQLVAEGLSTKEIADRVGVGVKTADKYRERIMNKLGLHDAVKLTRYAIRTGLVSLD